MKNRCPWCGKIVTPDIWIPVGRFLFRCPHCNQYYGKNNHSKQMLGYGVGVLLPLFLIKFIWFPIVICWIFASLIFLLVVIARLPYLKMAKSEFIPTSYSFVKENQSVFYAEIQAESSGGTVKKGRIYPQILKFETYSNYSMESPIQIWRVNNKTNMICASFLYKHPSNADIMAGKEFTIFDDSGVSVKMHMIK